MAAIEPQLFDQILNFVRWRTRPWFFAPGRTAWYKLDEPLNYLNRPGICYKAAKLKGVGFWNPDDQLATEIECSGRTREPSPPTSLKYEETDRLWHMGVSAEGDLAEVVSFPAPYGGILHERAVLEYTNAVTLHEQNVPSIAPLAVVRYSNLSFHGQPLGAVISLSTEQHPYRTYVNYLEKYGENAGPYFLRVYQALGVDGDPLNPFVQWQAYTIICRRLGALLRTFAEAGFYRYSSHLGNFHFDVDRNELFLTDLDSSRRLDSLPPDMQVLQIMRDVASTLYKAAVRLYSFFFRTPWPIDTMRSEDPFVAVLRGYFHEALDDTITRAVEPIWRFVLPYLYSGMRKRKSKDNRDHLLTEEAIQEFDWHVFYGLTVSLVFDFFLNSSLTSHYASGITREKLREKILHFLGPEQFDYLCYLER
jgi:hypothetical protein